MTEQAAPETPGTQCARAPMTSDERLLRPRRVGRCLTHAVDHSDPLAHDDVMRVVVRDP